MRASRSAYARTSSLLLLGTLVLIGGRAIAAGDLPEPEVRSAGQDVGYQNLQVLPADASRDELSEAMLQNLGGLGLPRRDGEGCLYCHVGDFDQPRDTWDYASDEKVAKRKARAMMAMVVSINRDHLAPLDERVAPEFEVTCATCHAGRIDPRPLPDILTETYRDEGIDVAIARYRSLNRRYEGADAYDFRPAVLARLASQIAASGAFDDAIALANVNAEVFPEDGTANGTVLMLEIQRSYAGDDVAAALATFDALDASDRARWVTFSLLDSVGWTIHRLGDEEAAVAIFRRNLERFPDRYIPHESLADALIFADDREAGIALYEAWLQRHPNHETARRRLAGLR